ncbi:type III secretion system protein SctP [Burkholderia sp. AW49-1]
MPPPSISNTPAQTDTRHPRPAYSPSLDAPPHLVQRSARMVESPAEPRTGADPVGPDWRRTSHDNPDEVATSAFATGTRVARPGASLADTFVPECDRFCESMAPFVHQMAQFCSNAAIRLAGNWNARLVLDERILAATTLNLSLSRFDLSLAFETRDPSTRQFLAAHLDELEYALRVALHTLGQANDVFLSIR